MSKDLEKLYSQFVEFIEGECGDKSQAQKILKDYKLDKKEKDIIITIPKSNITNSNAIQKKLNWFKKHNFTLEPYTNYNSLVNIISLDYNVILSFKHVIINEENHQLIISYFDIVDKKFKIDYFMFKDFKLIEFNNICDLNFAQDNCSYCNDIPKKIVERYHNGDEPIYICSKCWKENK